MAPEPNDDQPFKRLLLRAPRLPRPLDTAALPVHIIEDVSALRSPTVSRRP